VIPSRDIEQLVSYKTADGAFTIELADDEAETLYCRVLHSNSAKAFQDAEEKPFGKGNIEQTDEEKIYK